MNARSCDQMISGVGPILEHRHQAARFEIFGDSDSR